MSPYTIQYEPTGRWGYVRAIVAWKGIEILRGAYSSKEVAVLAVNGAITKHSAPRFEEVHPEVVPC